MNDSWINNWKIEAAGLINSLLNCESAEEAHDFIVNYAADFEHLANHLIKESKEIKE